MEIVQPGGGNGDGVDSLNGLTGDVILAAGSNITLTPSGNIITIASTGGGGSQTPWTSDIDAAGFSVNHIFKVAGDVTATGSTGYFDMEATVYHDVFTNKNTIDFGTNRYLLSSDGTPTISWGQQGVPKITNVSGQVLALDSTNITTTRTQTFPDKDGTFAMLSDIPTTITLQTNGVSNGDQTLLNLVQGTNITLTDNGTGSITIDATGGGGTPASPDTSIQFNNSGSFGGSRLLYTSNASSSQINITPQTTADTDGFNFNILGSLGKGTGRGGAIYLEGGEDEGQIGVGGSLYLPGCKTTGTPQTVDLFGVDVVNVNQDGGGINIAGADGGATSGVGGSITLTGGDAQGGDSDGGGVTITGGSPDGAGNSGIIEIRDSNGNGITIDSSGSFPFSIQDTFGGTAFLDLTLLSGAQDYTFPNASGTFALTSDLTGFVTSVSGTANRITSTGGTTPVIDISASYVGQSSITTLGTIATGVWHGTKIGLLYGGTNADLSGTGGTAQYLKQVSAGAAITVGTIPASDIASGAALTKVDDTNITLTLGGTPTTALLVAASLTLGWTGTLAVTRGGTGGGSASITLFNNITGYSAAGTTGTTSTNLVFSTSPTLVTPVLGAATATSINKVTITAPASSATLTIADGKTFTVNNTMTLAAGADSQTFTFPAASTTVAGLGTTQTFAGINTFSPTARASGTASYFTINAAADTGITASTESKGINIAGATRTWADGTVTTQREYFLGKPTYNKTTTSATFTTATTFYIEGAPVAGTGVTITDAYSAFIDGNNTRIGGTAVKTKNSDVSGIGVEIGGTNNTTGGMNLTISNASNGTSAFADLFLQNDLSDNTGAHYGVVNLNSSTYSDTTFGTALAVANQMSIYGTDGPTMVGSFKASTGAVNIIVGGSASTNEIARFTTTGMTIGLAGTLTGKVRFAGATSNYIDVVGVAAGGSTTNTLQAVTDTFVYKATTDTLSNKSLSGPTVLLTGATLKLTVPTVDLTATGPTNGDFNSGYSSSAIGDLVYLDSSSTWQKCDANTLLLYNGFLAIALEVKASGNALLVALPGSFIYSTTGFPTWTIGGPIYMSETAGAMTQTAPTTTDSATRVVGWGIHADKMYFYPSPNYAVHT